MCYPKPGPRCSKHARQALDAARTAHARAEAEVERIGRRSYFADLKAFTEQAKASGVELTREEKSRFADTHPYWVASHKSIAALDALRDAEAAYDATPAGIADLKALIAERSTIADRNVLTDPAYQDATLRLERGQRKRADQMAAHKHAEQLIQAANPERHDTDTVEDEAAAATPAPACTCITYTYKGDCEHLAARTAQARQDLLPTTEEASLRLHAAHSRLRSLAADEAKWQAWLHEDAARTVRVAHGVIPSRSALTNPEFAAFDDTISAARKERGDAKIVFYGIPGGAEYLRQRASKKVARLGYTTEDTVTIEEDIRRYATQRREAAAKYHQLTGQTAPARETTWAPPQLMYGNGCPSNCHDFTWTGDCAHVNEATRRQEQADDALSQALATRNHRRRLARATRSKKPSRLGRLLGRP